MTTLEQLFATKEIVVCCGSGGVGKTSVAAAAALGAATRIGGKTLVLTIDPARRLATALGLDGIVEFSGRVPFAESERGAEAADVLLVIDAPADENLFLPSKAIDYLPAGKPILALTPLRGATADLMRSLGYPVIAPEDEEGIATAIDALLQLHHDGRLRASEQHAAVVQQYDIRRTTAAFARVLEQCV